MRLADKVAIVTGGSKGIGSGIARVFCAEGASVVIAGRGPEGGNRMVAELEAAGGSAWYVSTDVTDSASIQAMIQGTVPRYGRLDILVNRGAPSCAPSTPNALCPGWVKTPLVEDWFSQQKHPEASRRYIFGAHPLGY